jgi:hypothetical protein
MPRRWIPSSTTSAQKGLYLRPGRGTKVAIGVLSAATSHADSCGHGGFAGENRAMTGIWVDERGGEAMRGLEIRSRRP